MLDRLINWAMDKSSAVLIPLSLWMCICEEDDEEEENE